VALDDNTFDMDKQEKVYDDYFKTFEKVMMDKMTSTALSIYRDYITDFVEDIESKSGVETWSKVRNDIRFLFLKKPKYVLVKKQSLIASLGCPSDSSRSAFISECYHEAF